MSLLDRIQAEIVAAMKAKDEGRLSAVRMIKAALKKHEIDSMKPLDEASEIHVLNTLVKQRRDSIEMYRKGNRPELAEKETAELKIVESFLPAAPSDEEVNAAIEAAIAETGASSPNEMGKVVSAAKVKLAGKRVDGKVLSDKVRAQLSK
jgi:uncharacterized protein YqeY